MEKTATRWLSCNQALLFSVCVHKDTAAKVNYNRQEFLKFTPSGIALNCE